MAFFAHPLRFGYHIYKALAISPGPPSETARGRIRETGKKAQNMAIPPFT
jgi:hypothetical protein